MNTVECRIVNIMDVIGLHSESIELLSYTKETWTKLMDIISNSNNIKLKMLESSLLEIQRRCGRISIHKYKYINKKERDQFIDKFDIKDPKKHYEENFFDNLIYVERVKDKKPLLIISYSEYDKEKVSFCFLQ